MCFGGGPKVDNTVQNQQMQEAAVARRREEDRQKRITAGSGMIDAMFGGGTVGDGQLGADAMFDPAGSYYLSNGSAWSAADEGDPTQWNSGSATAKPRTAAEQFADLSKNGILYSGTKQVTGFDDSYYQDRENAYMDFYQPQLDDQFKTAGDQLTFALARAGTLNSTLAGQKQGDLQTKYGVQRASVLSQAQDAVAQQQARVNAEKSTLVAQLNATGDADRASNEALSRTQQMFNQKPAYNALPDIFSGAAAGIGNYFDARDNRKAYNTYFGSASPNTKVVS